MNVRPIAVAVLVPALAGALTSVAAQTSPADAPQKPITWPAVNSQIGVTYPIDELENTLMFTLESAAVAARFAAADKNIVAGPGKRLLILTGSLANPQTHTYPLGAESVGVNAFSETGERSVNTVDSFILPALTSLAANLKPKEKVRYVTVVQIHAAGPIKRVAMFRGSRGTRRAWYDVEQDLAPIESTFANGVELRERAETTIGKTFDLGAFDMVVESAGPVGSAGAYAVTLKVTNTLRAPEKFGWQYARPALVDTAGKELSWNSDVIDTATGKSVVAELLPGQPYVLQYAFTGERGRTLKTFTLAFNAGRTIVVELK